MTDPAPPQGFSIHQLVRDDGVVVVSAAGEIDLFTAPQLGAVLSELAAAGRDALLDLSHVGFMDSTGLAVLVRASREAEGDGWSFALIGELQDEIGRLLDLTDLRGRLTFERDE